MTQIYTDHSAIKILSVLSVAKHKFRAGGVLGFRRKVLRQK